MVVFVLFLNSTKTAAFTFDLSFYFNFCSGIPPGGNCFESSKTTLCLLPFFSWRARNENNSVLERGVHSRDPTVFDCGVLELNGRHAFFSFYSRRFSGIFPKLNTGTTQAVAEYFKVLYPFKKMATIREYGVNRFLFISHFYYYPS